MIVGLVTGVSDEGGVTGVVRIRGGFTGAGESAFGSGSGWQSPE